MLKAHETLEGRVQKKLSDLKLLLQTRKDRAPANLLLHSELDLIEAKIKLLQEVTGTKPDGD